MDRRGHDGVFTQCLHRALQPALQAPIGWGSICGGSHVTRQHIKQDAPLVPPDP